MNNKRKRLKVQDLEIAPAVAQESLVQTQMALEYMNSQKDVDSMVSLEVIDSLKRDNSALKEIVALLQDQTITLKEKLVFVEGQLHDASLDLSLRTEENHRLEQEFSKVNEHLVELQNQQQALMRNDNWGFANP
jgi:chromosome segregation ATPase